MPDFSGRGISGWRFRWLFVVCLDFLELFGDWVGLLFLLGRGCSAAGFLQSAWYGGSPQSWIASYSR